MVPLQVYLRKCINPVTKTDVYSTDQNTTSGVEIEDIFGLNDDDKEHCKNDDEIEL